MYDPKKIAIIKQWLGSGSINIFGRPFSGKDSQGRILADVLGGDLISSGEILRSHANREDLNSSTNKGKMFPTDKFFELVAPFLSQPNFDNKPLILSSIGRWHGEESGIVSALKTANHPLKSVIYLDISKEDAYKRDEASAQLMDRQGRDDDSEEVLATRFDEFDQKTIPVIDYYRDMGILINIDGRPSRDIVTKEIIDILYEKFVGLAAN
jgi:adenylate kinase